MTGFASLTHEDERATIGITIRAVNHRFLDLQLRMPQLLGDLESRVRSLLQKRLARGRVELAISVQVRQASVPTVDIEHGQTTYASTFAEPLAYGLFQSSVPTTVTRSAPSTKRSSTSSRGSDASP